MKPLNRLWLALLIALLFCSAGAYVVRKGLKKYLVHTDDKLNSILVDTTAYEILFVGSSRTHSNIDPKIVDSITGLRSYNAGFDGANMYEFKTLIDGYLQKHRSPTFLVLNIDLFSFDTRRKLFNYTNYLPYSSNASIDSVLCQNEHYSIMYRYLPFFYLSELDDFSKRNAVKGWRGATELAQGAIRYKGFLSLGTSVLDTTGIHIPKETMRIDTGAVSDLQKIIHLCKQEKINLFFTYAPEYRAMWQRNVTNAEFVFDKINGIAANDHIPFLRYDTVTLCNNAAWFYNVRHLNLYGARLFSAMIANDIVGLENK